MTPSSTSTVPAVVVALSGNPRRGSRTATVARAVAGRVAVLATTDPVAEGGLSELGATVPTRAVSVTEPQRGDLDSLLDRWAVGAAPLLRTFVTRDERSASLVGGR